MTSTIKVNNVQNQCGQNIINENSNTITIGASGDTIALASGASQTGFGRTGTVDWQTGDIKTSTFTAANGEGYFANTSGSAFTMNLPAGSAGNIVSVVDYTNTFDSNNLTIAPNGSQKIGGNNASYFAQTRGQSLTFVYVDDTEGWKNVQDSTSNATGNAFVVATGGTITTCGDYKIHTFTGPGTFTVSQVAVCAASNKVDYLVAAGGGGGGGTCCTSAGAGGAGGFRYYANTTTNPQSGNPGAPLNAYGSPTPSGTEITVTATSFPIAVGGGGPGGPDVPGGPTLGTNGNVSTFSTVTSAGGGGGHGYKGGQPLVGNPGGSGGGGSYGGAGGSGNTPPVTPSQGKNGGAGDNSPQRGGGGGGAIAVGTSASSSATGDGGAGAGVTGFGASNGECSSCKQYFSGGGGGGSDGPAPAGGTGGLGGGGAGGKAAPGTAGTANTGGGGGAGQSSPGAPKPGATGGSGIVVIRYKYQ
jgi:hypothetical protein